MNLFFLDFTAITNGISNVFTMFLELLEDLLNFVTAEGHELVLVFILIPLLAFGISIFQSLLGTRNKEK